MGKLLPKKKRRYLRIKTNKPKKAHWNSIIKFQEKNSNLNGDSNYSDLQVGGSSSNTGSGSNFSLEM